MAQKTTITWVINVALLQYKNRVKPRCCNGEEL